MIRLLPVIALLSGCIADQGGPESDICNAEEWAPYIGQPAAKLAQGYSGPVRVIAPDMAVTMDYVPDRLNLLTDKDGILQSASCG